MKLTSPVVTCVEPPFLRVILTIYGVDFRQHQVLYFGKFRTINGRNKFVKKLRRKIEGIPEPISFVELDIRALATVPRQVQIFSPSTHLRIEIELQS